MARKTFEEHNTLWVETDSLRCSFDWVATENQMTDRPGVKEVRIREPLHWPVAQPIPLRGVWLWPEYFMRKGLKERTRVPAAGIRHELRGNEIVYAYAAEGEWQIEMEVGFCVHDNVIDARYTLSPHKYHEEFELFMASYIDNAFGETLVQARNVAANEGWTIVENRRHLWCAWAVLADSASAGRFFDGRWNFIRDHEREHSFIMYYTLRRPVIVVRSVLTGAAIVFLGDPRQTTYVCGQYHERDTAHDFAFFGKDLAPGRTIEARVRTLLLPGVTSWGTVGAADSQELWETVDKEWTEWVSAGGIPSVSESGMAEPAIESRTMD